MVSRVSGTSSPEQMISWEVIRSKDLYRSVLTFAISGYDVLLIPFHV